MVRYGVWNGIKYDNTLGNDKTPEGLEGPHELQSRQSD